MKTLILALTFSVAATSAWGQQQQSGPGPQQAGPGPQQAEVQSAPKTEDKSAEKLISKYCDSPMAFEGLVNQFKLNPSEDHYYPGSNELGNCQIYSNKKISKFYSNGHRAISNFSWDASIVLSQFKDKCQKASEDQADKEQKLLKALEKEYKSKLEENQKMVLRCESIAYVLSKAGVNWGKPTKNEPKEFKQMGIKCRTSGLETLDYDACVDFAESFENFEAVQNLGYQGQQLVYQNKMADEQAKFAEEKDAAKGALKATKNSMESQQDMYNQRAAVDGAKLAMLYSKYKELPNEATIEGYCKNFKTPQNTGMKLEEGWGQGTCKTAVIGNGTGFEILQNQDASDKMKAKLITVAASAGQNLIVAGLLGKRANDIDKALAKVDSFSPIDPMTISEDEFLTTFCTQNPGAEKCLAGGLDRTIDGISDNVITFGDVATGTAYENPYNPQASNAVSSSGGGSGNKTPDAMGSVLPTAIADNSIEGSNPAEVKKGAGGGAGGGGGGAGGGSASTSGGGGGSSQGQGQQEGRVAAKAPNYGGGTGGLSLLGGFGINKPKAQGKDEGNPFGKLFDKDGAKNNVVNLQGRGIASDKVGDKGEDLFKMISKRYSSVNADKRLLEYELAK